MIGWNNWLLNWIEIHLAFVATELKTEATAVTQTQHPWLFPFRFASAVAYTVAEVIAQTVAALHQDASTLLFHLQSGTDRAESMLPIEVLSLMVGNVVEEGEVTVFRRPCPDGFGL